MRLEDAHKEFALSRAKLDREKLVGTLVETRARVGPLVTDTHLADAIIKYFEEK
jgi:hypothetical protein